MKSIFKYIIVILSFTLLIAACKKDDEAPQLSSLNIINATVGLASTQVNTTGAMVDYSTYPLSINFGSSRACSVPVGSRQISAVATANPVQNLFSFTKDFRSAGMYSLYLVGQMPTVDILCREEHFDPWYNVSDSAIAVRIINLSPNSNAVNVTLAASTGTNEFSGIAYKQQTDFKKYIATKAVSNTAFNFQVRDQAGILLASYVFTASNYSSSRFKPVTLILRGLLGGTGANALGISFIANY